MECSFCGRIIREENIRIADFLLKEPEKLPHETSKDYEKRRNAIQQYNFIRRAKLELYLSKDSLTRFLEGAVNPGRREEIEKLIRKIALERSIDPQFICEECFKQFRDVATTKKI